MKMNFGKITMVVGYIYIIATLFYIIVNHAAVYQTFGQRNYFDFVHNFNIWNFLLFILFLLPGVFLIFVGKKLMKKKL